MDCKIWKNGKTFSSQGILNRLEKSGDFTQNTGKVRPVFVFIFRRFLIEVYLLNGFLCLLNSLNKTLKKITGKWKEYWEIYQSENVGIINKPN